jgi:hypothetical protein
MQNSCELIREYFPVLILLTESLQYFEYQRIIQNGFKLSFIRLD